MSTTLVATTRPALQAAHEDVFNWIQARRKVLLDELGEVHAAEQTAQERKWATAPMRRRISGIEKHILFLDKVAAALNAGYALVPNFNFEALAVRTDKGVPSTEADEWNAKSKIRVGAARLPAGQGEFLSPEPELESWEVEVEQKDRSKKLVTMFRATQHAPVDVPFVLMKRELADALHVALQEKLFDEIGIVRDALRGDPVLVGRVNHPKKAGSEWDTRGVTFFIGWWFDVRTLEI